MIFTADVQYAEETALAAGLLFPDWTSDVIESVLLKEMSGIAAYEPGNFYKRELPCILSLLEAVEEPLDAIVVDGFATLGSDEKAGLGMHLYDAIGQSVPVIGVAKRSFLDTPEACEVLRGSSEKPLFVTAVGMPLSEAKQYIATRHGNNRIPTLLKRVDQLCRGIEA